MKQQRLHHTTTVICNREAANHSNILCPSPCVLMGDIQKEISYQLVLKLYLTNEFKFMITTNYISVKDCIFENSQGYSFKVSRKYPCINIIYSVLIFV